MIKLWKKLNLLSGENFDQIQEKVDQAEVTHLFYIII